LIVRGQNVPQQKTGTTKQRVSDALKVCPDLEALPKTDKLHACHTQEEIAKAIGVPQGSRSIVRHDRKQSTAIRIM